MEQGAVVVASVWMCGCDMAMVCVKGEEETEDVVG